MKTTEIDLSSLQNAIASLKEATSKPPKNDLERDGAIQRFEFTFELAWKSIRRLLMAMGRKDVSASPKPVLRDAFEEHLISNIEEWFAFLESRYITTHIYNKKQAEKVFESAKHFVPAVEDLLKKLKDRQK